MSQDRPASASRLPELIFYGIVLTYFAFQGWRVVHEDGWDRQQHEQLVAVQRRVEELTTEVTGLRQEIDRLKTAQSQQRPVE
jgi:cell division protein FtsB